MVDARLTHPTRPTLPFHQRQLDSDETSPVANITKEIGTDRDPLIHTQTRERAESIRGLVTGNRRAENDPTTSDPRQAIANYADLLESHVDNFQGDGYTYEDDILDKNLTGMLTSIQWSVTPGQPDSLDYQASFTVGQGVMESQPITRQNPTVDTGMDVMLRVDGIDLPGMRDYQLSREINVDAKGVFDRDTAQNNDIVPQEGAVTTITFEGTLTGSASSRATTDANLNALVATDNEVTLETKFPGYNLDGFVTGYDSDQRQELGTEQHYFTLEFTEGIKA